MARVMKLIIVWIAAVYLAGCVQPGTYPLSGQECHSDDPVLGMSASDCMVPT